MDKTKIEQQAKKIMDEFLAALEHGEHISHEVGSERKDNIRKEGPSEDDPGFSERLLKNAPKTEAGYICAEKKKW